MLDRPQTSHDIFRLVRVRHTVRVTTTTSSGLSKRAYYYIINTIIVRSTWPRKFRVIYRDNVQNEIDDLERFLRQFVRSVTLVIFARLFENTNIRVNIYIHEHSHFTYYDEHELLRNILLYSFFSPTSYYAYYNKYFTNNRKIDYRLR